MNKHSHSILIFCLVIVTVLASGCGAVTVVPSPTGTPAPTVTLTSTRSVRVEITTIYKTPTPVGTCSGKIVFSKNQNGNHEVFSTDMGTFNPVNLTQNLANDSDPYCSPDGKLIAFWSDRDANVYPQDIFLMNLDGSNVVNITKQSIKLKGGAIYWSWDGQRIAALHTLFEIAIITLNPFSVVIIPGEEFIPSDWYMPKRVEG